MTFISRVGLNALFVLPVALANGAVSAEVVVVVSAKSATTTLSKTQLEDIFLGKTNRFPDGTPALPIDQPKGSVTRDKFYLEFLGKSPAQVKAFWSKLLFTGRGLPPKEAANGSAIKKKIIDLPSTIGYIDAKEVDDSVRVIRQNATP